MSIRFRDCLRGEAFRDLLQLAAARGFRAGVVVDDVTPGSRGEQFCADLQRLGAIEQVATACAGSEAAEGTLVLEFTLDTPAVDLFLGLVDDPVDLFGDGMPEMLTIFDTSGEVWFWSDGNEGSCGMNLDESEWRALAAGSTALRGTRTGMRRANLFDAGGAEELLGDLAMPLEWQEGRNLDAVRQELLMDELGRGPQVDDSDSLLRCLGAAALVLDVRRDCLGTLVWRNVGLERSGVSVSDAQVQVAENIVRVVLSSDLWRSTWPETSERCAVENDLRCLLVAP